MSILNEVELKTKINDYNNFIIGIGDAQKNTAQELRAALLKDSEIKTDMIDSTRPYSGVITNGVANQVVTAVPSLWNHFTTNVTTENQMLKGDQANGCVVVKEPGNYYVTLRFIFDYPTTEDLKIHLYANDAPNPFREAFFIQKGEGNGNPISKSFTNIVFPISTAMITAGGGEATIKVYVESLTGDFTLNQTEIILGVGYIAYSIRNF